MPCSRWNIIRGRDEPRIFIRLVLWEEIRYDLSKEKEILTEEGTDLGRKQQKRKERRDMATNEG